MNDDTWFRTQGCDKFIFCQNKWWSRDEVGVDKGTLSNYADTTVSHIGFILHIG